MAHFTLSYSFGVLVDGDPVSIVGSVTIPHALGEGSLKDAFVHAAHNGFPRLWDAAKPKPPSEEKT